jgi:hypothetical protein
VHQLVRRAGGGCTNSLDRSRQHERDAEEGCSHGESARGPCFMCLSGCM